MNIMEFRGNEEIMTIELPADLADDRRSRLAGKLAEYKVRREESYLPPEGDFDSVCKIAVLERIMAGGRVAPRELFRELEAEYGSHPDLEFNFVNACNVIHDYVTTGGQKVIHASRPFRDIPA